MPSERRNITQPSDWWAAFEDQAKQEGLSVAEWLGECGRANLPKKVGMELSKRPKVGAPKTKKPPKD